ncbi:MAG TPA: DUF4230 domain-containing protein [Saprospiraceae bacterium]|nr:DUF4230 domain-containing protein [Saprospiraceae bacterium]
MIKRIILLIILILVFILGIWFSNTYHGFFKSKKEETAFVLIKSIQKVTKLIAVEGYFSEIYSYKDYYGIDIFLFQKKALIRVKAKVSMGYDLEKLKIEAKTNEKKIIIGPLPKPQILSIDHDLDYYDVTEGTFNSFNAEDYNKLNKQAKDYIVSKIGESDLARKAEEQKNDVMNTIKTMVEAVGWKLEYEGEKYSD